MSLFARRGIPRAVFGTRVLYVRCSLVVLLSENSQPLSQGPHTKDVIKMVPVVSLFSTEHSKDKKTGSFSRIKIGKKM